MQSPLDKITRRRLLQMTGISTLGAFVAACARSITSGNPTTAPATAVPAAATAEPTIPGVNSSKPAPAQTPVDSSQVMITSNTDFYQVAYSDALPTPPSDWKLSVGGNVDKPISLALDEIMKMPSIEEMRTLECISNPVNGPLISNANWKGIKMADLLNM